MLHDYLILYSTLGSAEKIRVKKYADPYFDTKGCLQVEYVPTYSEYLIVHCTFFFDKVSSKNVKKVPISALWGQQNR